MCATLTKTQLDKLTKAEIYAHLAFYKKLHNLEQGSQFSLDIELMVIFKSGLKQLNMYRSFISNFIL